MPSRRRMLIIVLVGAIVAAGVFGVYSLLRPSAPQEGPALEDMSAWAPARQPVPLPEVAFTDETGAARTLAAFRGEVVVLNIWATWCTPCLAEMPALDRMQSSLAARGVRVVALSVDRDGPPVIREFFNRIGIRSLGVYSDTKMAALPILRVTGVPTTIIIDREGRERGRLVGPAAWDSSEAAEIVLAATQATP